MSRIHVVGMPGMGNMGGNPSASPSRKTVKHSGDDVIIEAEAEVIEERQ